MEIKTVKFRRDGFYSQPFAFGGEEGLDKFDINVRYRGSLQNYLIDTGDEVILVDTGLPAGTPEEKPNEKSLAYTGKDICSYMDAFKALGYQPEQVTKILLTHRHADHSGELRSFLNAKIYVNEEELSADELQGVPGLVPVAFTDGEYYNFPACQKICDGIFFVKAKGHTNGNSIIIVEKDGLFYMLHGDITYVDEALYENKLSVVYDDPAAARETLDRVMEFVRNHPTVYCGTHTPQGYENLEAKRAMDLAIRWRRCLPRWIFRMKLHLASVYVLYADMSMTRQSMTASPLGSFRRTGNVRGARSRRISLIGLKWHRAWKATGVTSLEK